MWHANQTLANKVLLYHATLEAKDVQLQASQEQVQRLQEEVQALQRKHEQEITQLKHSYNKAMVHQRTEHTAQAQQILEQVQQRERDIQGLHVKLEMAQLELNKQNQSHATRVQGIQQEKQFLEQSLHDKNRMSCYYT